MAPAGARPALALAVSLCAALPAAAQVVGDVDVVAELMIDYGLRVEKGTDGYGDPEIRSRIDGSRFSVSFYECKGGPCEAIQFSAGFDMDRPPDAGVINGWNREHRFGKAFLDDEGDPFIEMDVVMSGDGIGRRNFDDVLAMWQTALSQFRKTIDY